MDKEIEIEYQPNITTLLKVSKYILLNLPIVKIIFFGIIAFLILNNIPGLYVVNTIKRDSFKDTFPYIIIVFVWILIIFRTTSSLKKNLLKNKKNFEKQKVIFKSNSYIQEGETFKIENFWNEIYQIKETKSWFLIYPHKNSAFPIIKADLKDNKYNELKELFSSLNIKKSLK